MSLDTFKCPMCESVCWREEVDIGVGTQMSPWMCGECGWDEREDANHVAPIWRAFYEAIMRDAPAPHPGIRRPILERLIAALRRVDLAPHLAAINPALLDSYQDVVRAQAEKPE